MVQEDWWNFPRFREALSDALSAVREGKCECRGEDGWTVRVHGISESLVRYRINDEHKRCEGCVLGSGPVVVDGLHLLVSLLPESSRAVVLAQIGWLRSMTDGFCECKLRNAMKKQTAIVKLGGKYTTPHWRDLSYWEMLWGYRDYKGHEAMKEDTLEWLVRPVLLGGPLGEERFNEMMAEEMYVLMRDEWECPRDALNKEDWVANGRWMRGRAGTGRITTVKVENKVKRTRRMKGVDAGFMSDEDMTRELQKVCPERFVVMEKSEGVKVRPVVKTGTEMFRKMDFLGQWVEDGFSRCELSTLFGGGAGQDKIDGRLLEAVGRKDLWKVPMDQSNFDWHQSKASIATIMAVIGAWIETSGSAGADFSGVWEAMWDSLFASDVTVELGHERWRWANGLPSGFRWTALLDTFLNICSFRVAVRCASELLGRQICVTYHASQGDDITFAARDLEEVSAILHVYNAVGYEAHPSKTYFSRYRTEFLRKSYEHPLGVTGYLCRSLLSVRFRNPVLEMPILKPARLYSRLTLWHLMTVRGAVGGSCAERFLEDARQMGVLETDASGFALCPAAFGGGGLDPSSDMAATLLRRGGARWRSFDVEMEEKKVVPLLGRWAGRLEAHSAVLEPRHVEAFGRVLSRSWGIREADMVGKVSLRWKDVGLRPMEARAQWSEIPRWSEVWDTDKVPVMLRPFVREAALEKGTWRTLVRDEWVDWVERFEKRVSRSVFRSYLLGHISISWPLVDGVAMRYGSDIRRRYDRVLRAVMWTKDLGMMQLARYVAWIEQRVTEELRALSGQCVWGV